LAAQVDQIAVEHAANARPRADDLPDLTMRHRLPHHADEARIDHRRHPTGLKDEEILHLTPNPSRYS
jgi:hypothetical protein